MYIVALLLVYIEIQILKTLPSNTVSFSPLCKGDRCLPIVASGGWGVNARATAGVVFVNHISFIPGTYVV